ncbi:MAG: hypothetical protein HETSPECPRED_005332 [Heterodermia speciosa]|uniref:Metal homeostatis protein bsd2 n=1 Tax=Heterodermia speciosa TaxID=116794 RepID=A0A8H3ICY3_9LECA|nr:MAG: hypothetical protein HETSPECPRED_005332 [Heterodermia speciosa]
MHQAPKQADGGIHTDSQQIAENDQEDTPNTFEGHQDSHTIPSSPPPSFRSRASSPSSPHLLSSEDPITTDAERTLADTFDDGTASDNESNDGDARQRLMRGNPNPQVADDADRPTIQRAVTELPSFPAAAPGTLAAPVRVYGGGARPSSNDGVFANLSAKPEHGEKLEEQPPSYEQAAADATPPYWETTILAPGMATDEVYYEGLPVGSLFSFVWNGMISMSFQLVGFLLTYLLHTTHAAKNGSRAGLGITLVQYGFYMKGSSSATAPPSSGDPTFGQPPDPNSHDFDPSAVSSEAASAAAAAAMAASQDSGSSSGLSGIASSDWFAYVLMIVGWFILIRAVSDFFKARRHEQLVLQSPDRGLNVPIVADGERAETAV